MKLRELIELFRQEVDDLTEPQLWSDAEVIDYANDAQNEACRRARLLVDSSTTAIVQLAYTTSGLLTLDPRVLFVRRARLAGQRPLTRKNMQDMESLDPYWQDRSASTPLVFIPDYETGKLLIWPPPLVAGTVLMTVVRDPLAEMSSDQNVPEVAARYHRSLRFWMMVRAYGKQDSEANDPKKMAEAMAMFEQEFGKKSSAIDEAWITREQSEYDGTY